MQTEIIPPHFNTYHNHPSLVFQFILSDFIVTYREILEIEQLNHKLVNVQKKAPSQHQFHHLLNTLDSAIGRLSGISQEHQLPVFSWNSDHGFLTKLKNHCSRFSQLIDKEGKDPIVMHRYANRSWLCCLQALDVIKAIQQLSGDDLLEDILGKEDPSDSQDFALLRRTIEKIISDMGRFSRLLARISLQYVEDENVVFFLLRKQEQFNEIYGPEFVEKLLCKMYPEGLKEAMHFLSRQFRRRGFDHLLPIIQTKIAQLEPV